MLNNKNQKMELEYNCSETFKKYIKRIVNNKYFTQYFDFLIFCNTLILSLGGILSFNTITYINDIISIVLFGEISIRILD